MEIEHDRTTDREAVARPAPSRNGREPDVSVLIRSCNNVQYVRGAVLSALRQRANFAVEIVIGDDLSDDGTLQVLSELVESGEGTVTLVRRSRRVGYAQNLFLTLEACRGRYVAVLDADDFWSSPNKLARQYRLLEDNPHLSAVGHRYLRVTGEAVDRRFGYVSRRQAPRITGPSFYRGAWIKHSTIMIRASCVSEIPDWVKSTPSEDIAVQALCIQHGDMGFLNDVMATCRIHGQGVVSSLGPSERLEWSVSSWQIIRQHAPVELQRACEDRLARLCFDLADALRVEGRHEASIRYRNLGASLGRDSSARRLKAALRGTVVNSVASRLKSLSALRPIPSSDSLADG